jgi:hypothetical protein
MSGAHATVCTKQVAWRQLILIKFSPIDHEATASFEAGWAAAGHGSMRGGTYSVHQHSLMLTCIAAAAAACSVPVRRVC